MEHELVYICSPYRGNIFQKIRNIRYARHMVQIALELGYTPIATHLYLPQVLKDRIPKQRQQGLHAGKEILKHCSVIMVGVRYGISAGMKTELEAAAGKKTMILI